MGGAVSSGKDNNELIDNLMGGNYIRTRNVERVFRALDRADYMTPESRDQAYKDLAWRNGALHMSSPCIYSEVMEGLELQPGQSFLNIGSGTGYLSTLAGLILGSGGISHGIEVHSSIVDYANKKLSQFIALSPTLDEFDFCEPKFFVGNGLCLPPQQLPYDRVYCGAGCPDEYENYFKRLIKVGGVLVMPLRESLLQVRRVDTEQWVTRNLLTVSFATLRVPLKEDALNYVRLDEQTPPRLQVLARATVRSAMRGGVLRRAPELREPEPRRPGPATCPRRICIPIEPNTNADGLNILHDLDADTGADEMNALLSLVIRMDQNRVAGAIRFDRIDSSPSESISASGDSSDSGPSSDHSAESRRVRPRRSRSAPRVKATSDEGQGSLSDMASNGRDSSSATSSTVSKDRRKSDRDRSEVDRRSKDKNGHKSDRDSSESSKNTKDRSTSELKDARKTRDGSDRDRRSKEKNVRKTDNPVSDEDRSSRGNSRRNSGRKSPNDRKSSGDRKTSRDKSTRRGRSGSSRRSGSSGSLLAFEFQAADRSSQPTTSAGAGRNADSSANTSENDGDSKKNKKSSSRPLCHACNPAGSEIIPAEVELCFRGGRLRDMLPTDADMMWEETYTDAEELAESSHDEEVATESTSNSKAKRQKLDSGIGENTPSGSSPDKSKTVESDTDDRPLDSVTDDSMAPEVTSRRRVHKRSRYVAESSATSTSSSSTEEASAGGEGGGEARAGGEEARAARRRAARRSYDARRTRLSILMKRAVKELPLPYALKKYVNYGRCFQF